MDLGQIPLFSLLSNRMSWLSSRQSRAGGERLQRRHAQLRRPRSSAARFRRHHARSANSRMTAACHRRAPHRAALGLPAPKKRSAKAARPSGTVSIEQEMIKLVRHADPVSDRDQSLSEGRRHVPHRARLARRIRRTEPWISSPLCRSPPTACARSRAACGVIAENLANADSVSHVGDRRALSPPHRRDELSQFDRELNANVVRARSSRSRIRPSSACNSIPAIRAPTRGLCAAAQRERARGNDGHARRAAQLRGQHPGARRRALHARAHHRSLAPLIRRLEWPSVP